jgi:hypothetical protein
MGCKRPPQRPSARAHCVSIEQSAATRPRRSAVGLKKEKHTFEGSELLVAVVQLAVGRRRKATRKKGRKKTAVNKWISAKWCE